MKHLTLLAVAVSVLCACAPESSDEGCGGLRESTSSLTTSQSDRTTSAETTTSDECSCFDAETCVSDTQGLAQSCSVLNPDFPHPFTCEPKRSCVPDGCIELPMAAPLTCTNGDSARVACCQD